LTIPTFDRVRDSRKLEPAMEMSRELHDALYSFCGHSVEPLAHTWRETDFDVLRAHVAVFHSLQVDIRSKVLYLLGSWAGPRGVDTITELLPTLEGPDLISALTALGTTGAPAAVKSLRAYRTDPAPDVRRAVIHALSNIAGPEARAELEQSARADPESHLRERAARVLSSRQD
jgi:hypothetical protein